MYLFEIFDWTILVNELEHITWDTGLKSKMMQRVAVLLKHFPFDGSLCASAVASEEGGSKKKGDIKARDLNAFHFQKKILHRSRFKFASLPLYFLPVFIHLP